MKYQAVPVAVFCLGVFIGTAIAANAAEPARWDRGSAMAAVRSVNVDAVVNEIGNVASLSDGKATLEKLQQLETRSDWPLPAREAALYKFTRLLAGLPREAVAVEVLQHLQAYQAQALVPHEDHGGTLVPLYNIRGAAAGVENSWQRAEFAIEAVSLLETDAAGLVSAYVESGDHNQRSGYLDGLRQAGMNDIADVQSTALDQLDRVPTLTPLVCLTALITTDTSAIRQLLVNGRGAGLSSALTQLSERLGTADMAGLLTYAINEAPAVNASLAIAAWWPGLRHDAAIRDLLLEHLADPEVGATVALALARGPDIQTIKALQDTADGDSVAARRAQMALDMNRDGLAGEVLR